MHVKSVSKWGVVAALAIGVAGAMVAPVHSQNPSLVFGSSSGASQVIKSTSNALWVSIQGIIAAANGGTGNGFTAFTGPASTTKTFTLPNATSTILTSNAAVTFGQGGTGLATAADDTVMVSSGSAWVASAVANCTDTGGNHLNYTASTNAFSCGTSGASGFPLLATDGTKGAPSYSWASATTSGWYRVGTGEFEFSLGNSNVIDLQASVITFPTNHHIGWSTSTTDSSVGEQTYITNVAAGCIRVTGVGITSGYNAVCAAAPTFTSGCGGATGRSVSGSAFAFQITVGSSSADTSCVIGLPNLNNGWSCRLQDQTTVADLTNQTANTSSSASFTSTIAWTAADKLIGSCVSF